GITKAAFLVDRHEDVIATIYRAFDIATSGEPGPVLVELSGNIQLFPGEVKDLPKYQPSWRPPDVDPNKVKAAVDLIMSATKPGLYVGWGARDATPHMIELAELLGAPVATTLQGLSVFPAN